MKDILSVIRKLKLGDGASVGYFALSALESELGFQLSHLPFAIRILLESVLRNCDGNCITREHLAAVAHWSPPPSDAAEIPFKPARVLLQDFTGVPVFVDLASMRDAVSEQGQEPRQLNPRIPCDLVVDHSLDVDFFGSGEARLKNEELEVKRNAERYQFLKWAQKAFSNVRVIPSWVGIVHQVNLEYLASVVHLDRAQGLVYPDTCIGTDSHTPMVNGIGVLAWGVGGIEAESALLGQPLYFPLPEVLGVRLSGELSNRASATDLVLHLTACLRDRWVVGKFVEFFGPGVASLNASDRATISNMAPEQGGTVSFFPVDGQTLSYLRATGRSPEHVDLVERYCKEQLLFRDERARVPDFSAVLEFDLGKVEPVLAGPRRPQDRLRLGEVRGSLEKIAPLSCSKQTDLPSKSSRGVKDARGLSHGAIVIAAITSCTNTSNPSSMLAAALLARNAVKRGLKVPAHVKTSLAPGSRVVTRYLEQTGLLGDLEALGFHLVGYGCTTCIGNSGPLAGSLEDIVREEGLVVCSVLSGNRNFEGRIHPLVRANYLASPAVVVAYALAGSVQVDLATEPLGLDEHGAPVWLDELWPAREEVDSLVNSAITPELFENCYRGIFEGSTSWSSLQSEAADLYAWEENSTYIKRAPFCRRNVRGAIETGALEDIRVLVLLGDSVTTDHISPAGRISPLSPAGEYLKARGLEPRDFNSYGSRRGNHEVMARGAFANIRLNNLLVPGCEGGFTVYHPTGEIVSIYEASLRYQQLKVPLMVIAGKEYGSGSSRDWAAKGPYLLGVRIVLAESFERIHRSNLVQMGILPVSFARGETVQSLGLS